jgi:hypothetical protein
MAGIKIENMRGKRPRSAPELLAGTEAQTATNVKLYSGNLIPYRIPQYIAQLEQAAPIRKLFGSRAAPGGAVSWLSWAADIDIIQHTEIQDESGNVTLERRFYYSGDGVPKVSTHALATTGAGPYPVGYYTLGLPLPDTVLTTDVTAYTAKTVAEAGRDTANTAYIKTAAAHELRSGNVVTVRKFTGTDTKTLNVIDTEVVVLSSTEFTYFSPGEEITVGAATNGRVNLAGGRSIRTYVYTWITPWGEESVPSKPSPDIYIREGQTITIEDIPTTAPAGDTFIRGVRLYRTVVTANGADYFRVQTLWFPTGTVSVQRVGGVSTVTLAHPHNFVEGDRFKLSGLTTTSFNVEGTVTETVDRFSFRFAQALSDVALTADATGTLFHDISETPASTARYWGDGSDYDFVDDFESRNMLATLESSEYDPPPPTLKGLTMGPNNIALGFVGNQLCMSEPLRPHAWPERNRLTVEHTIVAVAVVMGTIVILTDAYPYRVEGARPDAMSLSRIDAYYPCLSKRSVVNMDYGVVWATSGGLAMYSPNTGTYRVTRVTHDWDTWVRDVDPDDINAVYFKNKYFGAYAGGAFLFEKQDDEFGGEYTDATFPFSATWLDEETNKLFFIPRNDNSIYEWDNELLPYVPMAWRSKVIVTPQYMNMGAARVIADYDVPVGFESIERYNQQIAGENLTLWEEMEAQGLYELATLNSYMFNGAMFNGDTLMQDLWDNPYPLPVVFSLWVGKNLIFQTEITDSSIFRLPTGYRTDTFEVGVSGAVRVRAIHIGETPLGLRDV